MSFIGVIFCSLYICFVYFFCLPKRLLFPLHEKNPALRTRTHLGKPHTDRNNKTKSALTFNEQANADADACRCPHKSFAFDLRQGRFINKLPTAAPIAPSHPPPKGSHPVDQSMSV